MCYPIICWHTNARFYTWMSKLSIWLYTRWTKKLKYNLNWWIFIRPPMLEFDHIYTSFIMNYHRHKYSNKIKCGSPSFMLTYCKLVLPYGNILALAQVMACCLMASSHYLNQCRLCSSTLLNHSTKDNSTGNNHYRTCRRSNIPKWQWVSDRV